MYPSTVETLGMGSSKSTKKSLVVLSEWCKEMVGFFSSVFGGCFTGSKIYTQTEDVPQAESSSKIKLQ